MKERIAPTIDPALREVWDQGDAALAGPIALAFGLTETASGADLESAVTRRRVFPLALAAQKNLGALLVLAARDPDAQVRGLRHGRRVR